MSLVWNESASQGFIISWVGSESSLIYADVSANEKAKSYQFLIKEKKE